MSNELINFQSTRSDYIENAPDSSISRHLLFMKASHRIDAVAARTISNKESNALLVPLSYFHLASESFKQKLEGELKSWEVSLSLSEIADRYLDKKQSLLLLMVDASTDVIHGAFGMVVDPDSSKRRIEVDFVAGALSSLFEEACSLARRWMHEVLIVNEVGFASGLEERKVSFFSYPALKHAGGAMILTAGPSISSLEAQYVSDAARFGWNNRWNEYLSNFEAEFAEFVGTPYAISTSSCTGALHIALMALGIGPGDEVIVPEITWVATANAVRYVGARPVFADVDSKTWCLDPNSAKQLVNSRTRAIIPVHLYGHPANMSAIMKIAEEHGLYVVEDAAPSIGAVYEGRRTGSFGHFAAFSFQGAKLAVTGEGGMLVGRDAALMQKAKKIADQGRSLTKTFWIEELGLKYKMSNVQAALSLAQLQRIEDLIASKRRVFSWYEQRLKDSEHIELCYEPPGSRSIYWMSNITIKDSAKISRDELIVQLKKQNIDTRPVFPPISQYPFWGETLKPQDKANRIGRTGVNLPSGSARTEVEIDYVCQQILTNLS